MKTFKATASFAAQLDALIVSGQATTEFEIAADPRMDTMSVSVPLSEVKDHQLSEVSNDVSENIPACHEPTQPNSLVALDSESVNTRPLTPYATERGRFIGIPSGVMRFDPHKLRRKVDLVERLFDRSRRRKGDRGLQSLRKALKRNSRLFGLLGQVDNATKVLILDQRARLLAELGEFDEAIAIFDRCITDAKDLESLDHGVYAKCGKALTLVRKREVEKGMEEYQAILEDPQSPIDTRQEALASLIEYSVFTQNSEMVSELVKRLNQEACLLDEIGARRSPWLRLQILVIRCWLFEREFELAYEMADEAMRTFMTDPRRNQSEWCPQSLVPSEQFYGDLAFLAGILAFVQGDFDKSRNYLDAMTRHSDFFQLRSPGYFAAVVLLELFLEPSANEAEIVESITTTLQDKERFLANHPFWRKFQQDQERIAMEFLDEICRDGPVGEANSDASLITYYMLLLGVCFQQVSVCREAVSQLVEKFPAVEHALDASVSAQASARILLGDFVGARRLLLSEDRGSDSIIEELNGRFKSAINWINSQPLDL